MGKEKGKMIILGISILSIALILVGVLLWKGVLSGDSDSSGTQPGTTAPTVISFPYSIPGTDLVIQAINSYDGVFVEDGSNRQVTGISAMVLVNNGQKDISYADIVLLQGKTELHYKATCIPAGATLVVQEWNAAAYVDTAYVLSSADVSAGTEFGMAEALIKVEEVENGTLLITNLTEETISGIHLYYKFAYEMGEIYVGGITYSVKITDLLPGKSQKVTANHFATGFSEVVMISTYETAD